MNAMKGHRGQRFHIKLNLSNHKIKTTLEEIYNLSSEKSQNPIYLITMTERFQLAMNRFLMRTCNKTRMWQQEMNIKIKLLKKKHQLINNENFF